MENLNLIFNKTYYEKLGSSKEEFERDIAHKNSIIFRTAFDPASDFNGNEAADPKDTFSLMTTYPGMLIGTGNPHGTGEADADINVGFSFDFVTGQPYIPGSSVKGMLRSYFETKEKRLAIAQILKSITNDSYSDDDVKLIEKEIFDGNDVFFDAVVARGGRYGELVGPDYITPHNSPTKNPIPIHIIKVIPDVVFEFRFRLADEGILGKCVKKTLFIEMLKLFGIGAKTNTGYGRLIETAELDPRYAGTRPKENSENNNRSRSNNNNNKRKQNINPAVAVTVTGVSRTGSIFFKDNGKEGTVSAKKLGNKSFGIGDKVTVRFCSEKIFDDGKKVRFYELAE